MKVGKKEDGRRRWQLTRSQVNVAIFYSIGFWTGAYAILTFLKRIFIILTFTDPHRHSCRSNHRDHRQKKKILKIQQWQSQVFDYKNVLWTKIAVQCAQYIFIFTLGILLYYNTVLIVYIMGLYYNIILIYKYFFGSLLCRMIIIIGACVPLSTYYSRGTWWHG